MKAIIVAKNDIGRTDKIFPLLCFASYKQAEVKYLTEHWNRIVFDSDVYDTVLCFHSMSEAPPSDKIKLIHSFGGFVYFHSEQIDTTTTFGRIRTNAKWML